MNYMQDVGIVHRDLKSANVLLESVPINQTQSMLRGGFYFLLFLPVFLMLLFLSSSAVVCDFGLARVTNAATTLENQKFKEIGGFSPRYAAPEVLASAALQMTSDSEVDKKSDVYSFGIVLWELLTRRIPWDGMNREQIEMNVRGGVRVNTLFCVFVFVFLSITRSFFFLFLLLSSLFFFSPAHAAW